MSFIVSFKAGLPATNCLSLHSSWNIYILPSFMNNSFAGYKFLDCRIFSFWTFNMLSLCLLSLISFDQKSIANHSVVSCIEWAVFLPLLSRISLYLWLSKFDYTVSMYESSCVCHTCSLLSFSNVYIIIIYHIWWVYFPLLLQISFPALSPLPSSSPITQYVSIIDGVSQIFEALYIFFIILFFVLQKIG